MYDVATISGNAIGSLRDRARAKGIEQLVDAIEKNEVAPFLLYLFYPESSYANIPMPRLALWKLEKSVEFFEGIGMALEEDVGVCEFFKLAVNRFFEGKLTMWTNLKYQPEDYTLGNPITSNILLSNYYITAMRNAGHITGAGVTPSGGTATYYTIYLNEKSITYFYTLIFGKLKDGELMGIFRNAFRRWAQQKGEPTTQGAYITKMFDEVKKRPWLVATQLQWATVTTSGSYDYDAGDANKRYTLMLYPSGNKLKGVFFDDSVVFQKSTSETGVGVGDKFRIVGDVIADTGVLNYNNRILTVTDVFNDYILVTGATLPGAQGLAFVKYENPPQLQGTKQLILWLDLQAFQKEAMTFFANPRRIFLESVFLTKDAIQSSASLSWALVNHGYDVNTDPQGIVGYVNVLKLLKVGERYGLLIDSKNLQNVPGQDCVICVWPVKKDRINPKAVTGVAKLNNGTYRGGSFLFDPNGIVHGSFTVKQPGGDEGRIGGRVGELAAVLGAIGSILAILGTIAGIVTNIMKSFQNPADIGSYVPDRNKDPQLDTCAWGDDTYTWMNCMNADGTWGKYDTDYNYLGPGEKPGNFAALAPFVLISVAGGLLLTGNKKKKRK